MNIAILLIVGFIAIAFFVDAYRQSSRKKKHASESKLPERILTADESGPTETGRFRVQQALGSVGTLSESPGEKKPPIATDDEDAPLPDPFDGNESDKNES